MTARRRSRLGSEASADFRKQSSLCLAIARTREQPAQQVGLLAPADHWQRKADASDICLREAAEQDDERSFTVSLT